MMLMAHVGAALGRMGPLNALYAGTVLEVLFGAFLMPVILAGLMLLAKCLVFRSFDRWFAVEVAAFTASTVAISLQAKTQVGDGFATFLFRP